MEDLTLQKQQRIAQASSQQRQAADPAVSVWVEASAGTGKTKVLSDRVLRLLLNGTNPARILCLTYTKAAAVEMKSRIAERLSGWAVTEDEKLTNELEKLLGLKMSSYSKANKLIAQARRLFAILLDTPGGIKIQTIHSFCQEVLKRFPLEAKVSPYFEVMDDRAAKEALEIIKKDMLQGNLSGAAGEALAFLTTTASEYKFPNIMKSITEQRNTFEEYLQKYCSLDDLIAAAASVLNISADTSATEIEQTFWQQLPPENITILNAAFAAGTTSSQQKGLLLQQAVNQCDFEAYSRIFLKADGQPREKLFVKQSIAQFPLAEKIAADETERILTAKQHLSAANLLASTRAVLILADELLRRYMTHKKNHSQMDYNDLIILTKRLLEAPKVAEWILFKLDGGIDNVLIDEAQDTSPEQWSIIKALTKEFFSGIGSSPTTVFVVGDRKQSIYSFQGADPKEFEKMHHYFATQTSGFREVNMEVSFRSTAAVLDLVNTVFAYPKARSGVALPEQNISHKSSRIGDGGRIELWPLTEPDEDDTSDKIWLPPVERISGMSSSAKLARQIAENIKAKVSQGELLKSKGRPLKYRDFLILVQRRNAFVEEMVRACKNAGVAVTGVDKINLLEQIAISDLLALAKFTLLPEDDLNLACLLKSPLFALDDNDLFTLCYNRKADSLWQRLQNLHAYEQISQSLSYLKDLSSQTRPFEFFSHVLNDLQGRQKFTSRLGFECEDALDEFINLSLNFEQNHIPSMQIFVDWIQKDDVEIKRNLEQNDMDAVRLMTVHGSKGLQAPIVILPDTVRIKNIKKEAGLLKDKKALFYPLSKNDFEDTCCHLLENEKQKELEEYHRLLYVALTRAEECLCICGYKKKNKPNENSWYEICREAFTPMSVQISDEILVYDVAQQVPPQNSTPTVSQPSQIIKPEWLTQPAKTEDVLAKPLTPSHQDETGISALSPLTISNNNKLYNRGRLIHKLLQFIPAAPNDNRAKIITRFLDHQAADIPLVERDKITAEVLSLINNPQFAPLFSKNSLAEVALMGQVGDRIISGQIDRLVVTDNKVMIIDFKTNRPAAQSISDIPQAYIKQMQAYRSLIAKIYPHKEIETYILWTNTANIMKVE